jgi:hypothetical protein
MVKPSKRTTTTTPAAASRLPAALARRATAAASAKTARLLAAAREHLASIARRKGAVTEAFYDIGIALTALKERELVAALRAAIVRRGLREGREDLGGGRRAAHRDRAQHDRRAGARHGAEEGDGDDRPRCGDARSGLRARALSQEVDRAAGGRIARLARGERQRDRGGCQGDPARGRREVREARRRRPRAVGRQPPTNARSAGSTSWGSIARASLPSRRRPAKNPTCASSTFPSRRSTR